MLKLKNISRRISKTLAIAEKEVRTHLRFKYSIFINYFTPIISILMPFIVLGKFFELNAQFGPWTEKNYTVFLFIGYNFLIMRLIISDIPSNLKSEKIWKTLSALMIAPFNRFYLLFGYFLSELSLILIPFITFFIVIFILYPISLLTLFIVLFMFLGVSFIFTGIALLIGVFAISNENILSLFTFLISFIFWGSCITYPFELFPDSLKFLIKLNPIYYIIDIVRLTWIENNIFLTISLHSDSLLVFISALTILPITGVYTFNIIYKKLGVTGY